MTRHRFFVRTEVLPGASGELDEPRSRQAQAVLRLRAGDDIIVFDGSGVEGTATLTSVGRSAVAYKISNVEAPRREPEIELTVGLALLRGDRFELAVQKLTEIGVRKIVPLQAERCVVSFRDVRDWDKRAARCQRIIIEAMEQSERVTTVELSEPRPLEAFLEAQPTIALVERGSGVPIGDIPIQERRLALAVGPEGGWSEEELALIESKARHASLGGLILRAETAAIVAAGTIVQRYYSASNTDQEQGDTQRGS